jgi:biopolymer transport protein ExbD
MNSPSINVTPLIDVLLVLLIIFMVIAPLKPTAFQTRIPSKPLKDPRVRPNPDTLVASLDSDGILSLNNEGDVGTVEDPAKLTDRLRGIFASRAANASTERTVFIKAPRKKNYGEVAKLVDAVKTAGASPVSLQIDDLK